MTQDELDELWGQAGEGRPLTADERDESNAAASGVIDGPQLPAGNADALGLLGGQAPRREWADLRGNDPPPPIVRNRVQGNAYDPRDDDPYTADTSPSLRQEDVTPYGPQETLSNGMTAQGVRLPGQSSQDRVTAGISQAVNDNPHEAALMMAQQRLNAAQLSPADQLMLQRYTNAHSEIATQAAQGLLSEREAAQAQAMVAQRSEPLMVRASEVPLLMARLRYQQQMHAMAQQTALEQQTAAFRARTMEERTAHVALPSGNTASFVEIAPGRYHQVQDHAADRSAVVAEAIANHQATRSHQEQQRWDHIYGQEATAVRSELQHALHPPGGARPTTPDWYTVNSASGPQTLQQAVENEIRARAERAFGGSAPHLRNAGGAPRPMPAAQAEARQAVNALRFRVPPPAPATAPIAAPPAPQRRWFEPDIASPGS